MIGHNILMGTLAALPAPTYTPNRTMRLTKIERKRRMYEETPYASVFAARSSLEADWWATVCRSDIDAGGAHGRARLPFGGPVLEVAVATGEVQPLEHPRLEVVHVPPLLELVRLPAVVDDDLAGANRGRHLRFDDHASHVVEDVDLLAIGDTPGGS